MRRCDCSVVKGYQLKQLKELHVFSLSEILDLYEFVLGCTEIDRDAWKDCTFYAEQEKDEWKQYATELKRNGFDESTHDSQLR